MKWVTFIFTYFIGIIRFSNDLFIFSLIVCCSIESVLQYSSSLVSPKCGIFQLKKSLLPINCVDIYSFRCILLSLFSSFQRSRWTFFFDCQQIYGRNAIRTTTESGSLFCLNESSKANQNENVAYRTTQIDCLKSITSQFYTVCIQIITAYIIRINISWNNFHE